MSATDLETLAQECAEAVLKASGSALRHYTMHSVRHAILDAAASVIVAAERRERERCALACDAFDAPASDSDFVNGQATAAQQIRAAILSGIAVTGTETTLDAPWVRAMTEKAGA